MEHRIKPPIKAVRFSSIHAGIYAELVESEEKEWLVDWDRRHKSEEKE